MIRRKFLRLLNAIIAFSFLGLLVVYMQSSYPPLEEHTETIVFDAFDGRALHAVGFHPESDGDKWQMFSSASSPLSQEEIVASIEFLNANYEVLNVNEFGRVQDAKFVIVVQVHNRIEYLKYLIQSLEKARFIDEVLLIFSHDFSSSSINQLVKEIRFCRVMQIFYPYNIQLFPNIYPGQHPQDCPEGATKDEAKEMHCNNWAHPDKYGHYRVAKITQIKHHWWWKINYVFDGIMARYELGDAWVVLLEEDHYVAPDFLHVLKLIIENKKKFCEACQVISLGFYLKQYRSYQDDITLLGVHPWFSSKHNMGMAFDASTWQLIKNCSREFCTYDDYNWDWSLMHISMKCLPSKLRVIAVKAPRVLHVGDCGVHTHRCNVQNAPKKAQDLFLRVSERLFPSSLRVVENSRRMLKPSKENGGWGDLRDHELCLNNSRTASLRHPLDFRNGFAFEANATNVSHPIIFSL
uniref:Alpha-1,6-mannosyl-glycoprotein 2-beta-N-acetylglucosaminyltransferase n=1 Tax=Parascaris univalens TaxID=6257 RepID=A0A915C7L7_PARUN